MARLKGRLVGSLARRARIACGGPMTLRDPSNPEVPMLALTPEVLEAIEQSAFAYSEFCGIASDECNNHVRIISEAIAAARKSATCEAIADRVGEKLGF
jgi:hypothetical protein